MKITFRLNMYLLTIVAILSVSFSAYAQNCKSYYYLLNNAKIEMTLFDQKNNADNKLVYHISDVNNADGNTNSTIHSEMFDKKGNSISKGEGKFICSESNISVAMQMSMPGNSMDRFKGMEVKAQDAYLNYPAAINTGDALGQGQFNMDIYNSGVLYSKVDFKITNRKVEGKESITSSIGTWECYKITYDAALKVTMLGIGIPVNMKAIEWFAPGFGVVKSETYNKRGKFMGSTMITAFSK